MTEGEAIRVLASSAAREAARERDSGFPYENSHAKHNMIVTALTVVNYGIDWEVGRDAK